MRAISVFFAVTMLVISCTTTSIHDASPQAQPIITMFEAIMGNNIDLLKSVLIDSQLDDFNAEHDRDDGLKDSSDRC